MTDVVDVVDQLRACSSREQAHDLMAAWNLKADDLRAVAQRAGLRGVSGLTKADLTAKIVRHTVGARLDFAALRDWRSWKS